MMIDILRFCLQMVLGGCVAIAIVWGVIGFIAFCEVVVDLICDRLQAEDAEAVEMARIELERARAVARIRDVTNETIAALDDLYRAGVIDGTAREVDRR